MPIQYTLTQKVNLYKPEIPKKFYANAKSSGEVSFKSLSKEIAGGSTTVSDYNIITVRNEPSKLIDKYL